MTRIVVATDDFDRANGALGANWTNLNTNWGTITIASNAATCSTANTNNEAAAVWAGAGSFTDDQYAEAPITGLTFLSGDFAGGVIARASTGLNDARDFYFAYVAADSGGPNYTTVLGKVVGGGRAVLHSAAHAWSDDDLVGLEVEGTELRLCQNGTPLGGSFTQTDADLSTGKPGILKNGSAPNVAAWEGGNLSSVEPNPFELGAPLTLALTGTLTVSGDITITTGPVGAAFVVRRLRRARRFIPR